MEDRIDPFYTDQTINYIMLRLTATTTFRLFSTLIFLLGGLNAVFPQSHQNRNTKTYAYVNGLWWTGKDFVKATWYSVNGLLSSYRPLKLDSVIDLQNSFVIAPFGEAHNHNVGYSESFYELSHKYLKAGIFYVKVPNNFLDGRNKLVANDLINKDTTIDAVFANGGITGYKGHPYLIVQRNIAGGSMTEKEGEGDFYNTILSAKELEAKWPAILKNKPGFIKTYLLFSDEYEKRSNDSAYIGQRGMNPGLLSAVVAKAHKHGLKVAAHVETATDFHNAIIGGVDEIAHMPGFRADPMQNGLNGLSEMKYPLSAFLISEQDAKDAARKNIAVVTTLSGILQVASPKEKKIADSLFKINLRTLKQAGTKIVLGSDAYRGDSWWEIEYLVTTGIFTNTELLNMFSNTTPKSIFPNRKIAEFKNGYETSFLVLKTNPLTDITKAKRILFAVKGSTILTTMYE